MNETDQGIFDAVVELLTPFNADKIELKPETDISSDLNIDSVAVMDFVMEVEDRFDIDIPLNVLSDTRTINDLMGVIKERTSA